MNILTYINHNNKTLIGGMNIEDIHIDTYFKMYNLITWDLDKLYISSHNELDEYCKTVTKQSECNPPYQNLTNELIESNCCEFKGLSIHKKSINKFDINSEVMSKDKMVNFKFIKAYEKIYPQNDKQLYYDHIIKLINSNLNDEFITKNKEQILEILSDNGFDVTDISTLELKRIINDDEFMGLDDIFDLMFKTEPTDKIYQDLKIKSKSGIQLQSMQEYTNKLFEEIRGEQKIYHLYFSFGRLNNFERINWQNKLKIFINDIKLWISDPSINCIVLGGHSFGSCVIQKLGVELIKSGIDLSKIIIIGSGCRIKTFLTEEDLTLFKTNFINKHQFILNCELDENGLINYDHTNTTFNDTLEIMNKINTHLIICKLSNLDKKVCEVIIYKIINYDDIVLQHDKYKQNARADLHAFANYSQKYFMLKK